MTIRVFPIGTIADRGQDRGRNGALCPAGPTWTDTHDARRRNSTHGAQDIFAARDSDVVAPEAGVILDTYVLNGEWPMGGKYLHLRTTGGRSYYMAHMDAVTVLPGTRVEAGDILGGVGTTGNAASSCPHLHIQAREGGRIIRLAEELRRVDPTRVRGEAG